MNKIILFLTVVLLSALALCYKDKVKPVIDEKSAICIPTNHTAKFIHRRTVKIDESEYKYGSILYLLVDKSGFYLYDYKNDRFIKTDLNGKLKYIIGKKGSGPGEYIGIKESFTISLDKSHNIYIFNNERNVIIKYDSLNQFVKEKSFSDYGRAFYHLSFTADKPLLSLRNGIGKSHYYDFDFFHILNDSLDVLKTIPFSYPPLYEQYKLINLFPVTWVNDDEYIYVLFQALPYIYKYNYNGERVSVIGNKPDDFEIINRPLDMSLSKPDKIYYMRRFTTTMKLFKFKENYLIFSYVRCPKLEKNSTMKEISESEPLLNASLYTVSGERINIDWSGIGKRTGFSFIDSFGYTYLVNDEPDKREVIIYEIIIE